MRHSNTQKQDKKNADQTIRTQQEKEFNGGVEELR
jgi:hypothetical protein